MSDEYVSDGLHGAASEGTCQDAGMTQPLGMYAYANSVQTCRATEGAFDDVRGGFLEQAGLAHRRLDSHT